MDILRKALDAKKTIFARIFAAMTVGAWMATDAIVASAATSSTIGSRAQAIKDDLQNVYDLILIVAMLFGVVLAIIGVYKMTKSSREEGGMGKAIVFISAGALLIAIPALIMYTSGTLMGTDGIDQTAWK